MKRTLSALILFLATALNAQVYTNWPTYVNPVASRFSAWTLLNSTDAPSFLANIGGSTNASGSVSNVLMGGVITNNSTNTIFSVTGTNAINLQVTNLAIANNNGFGTNTTLIQGVSITSTNLSVISTTWLNNSNMTIFLSQIQATNSIPLMVESNLPSGLATASSYNSGVSAFPYYAFNTIAAQYWIGNVENNSWVQYQFTTNVTVNSFSGITVKLTGLIGVSLAYSTNGSTWVTAASWSQSSSTSPFTTNFPPVTANYFRWNFDNAASYIEARGYGLYLNNGINIVSNSVQIEIVSTNGVSINTNTIPLNGDGSTSALMVNGSVNDTGGYYVNGVPIGQIAGVTNTSTASTNSPTAPTFSSETVNYFSGCDNAIATNFNGYTTSQFISVNPNYFSYNVLPPGSIYTISLISLGYNPLYPSAARVFQYTVYTPNANTTSTNSPSTPLQNLSAVNNLVANLKSTGLWNHATNYFIYPFAAGNPGCNSENLVGTNYDLTFYGWLTNSGAHSFMGASNSTAAQGWADTSFLPSAANLTNLTIVAFASTYGSTNFMVSSYDGTNMITLNATVGSVTNLYSTINTTNAGTNVFSTAAGGDFFAIARTGSNVESGLIDSGFYSRTALTNSTPSSNIVLFARSAGASLSTNLTLGFVAAFDGLTTNQLLTLQGIVLQYQSEMGRLPSGSYSTNTLSPVSIYLTGGASPKDAGTLTNYQGSNVVGAVNSVNPTNWNAQALAAGVVTNAPSGLISWVDSVNGNDSTARLGRSDKPSLTISNAVLLATNGCLVWVRPGTYLEHNLLKSGVNYYGDAGANIYWKHTTTNEDMLAIFDDRNIGSTTNSIYWYGALQLDGLTNILVISNYWVINPSFEGNTYPNATAFSDCVILTTNSGTQLNGYIEKISSGNLMDAAGPYGYECDNNNNSHLSVGSINNSLIGVSYSMTFNGTFYLFNPSAQIGLYWRFGDLHFFCINNYADNNAVWCDEPIAQTVEQNLYYSGDLITSKIYTTARTLKYVGWFNVKRMHNLANGASLANTFDFYGSGKWYVTGIEKADANGTGGSVINTQPNAGTSNSIVWLDAQKISSSGGANWIKMLCGTLRGNVTQFEDAGGSAGISLSGNSEVHLSGITAAISSGSLIYYSSSSPAEFKNFTFQSTNGTPVFVSSNGLTLQNVNLISGNGAPSIGAASSLNVSGAFLANTSSTNIITIVGTNYVGKISGDGSLLISIPYADQFTSTNLSFAPTGTPKGSTNWIVSVTNLDGGKLLAGTVADAALASTFLKTIPTGATNQFALTNSAVVTNGVSATGQIPTSTSAAGAWSWQSAPAANGGTAALATNATTITVDSSMTATATKNSNGTTNYALSAVAVLTNITTSVLLQTNFISGQLYTNNYGTPLLVNALANNTVAAVNGDSELAIYVIASPANGGVTNYVSYGTTIGVTIAMTYTNVLSAFVPTNAIYYFTNLSSGAGNSATVSAGQIFEVGAITTTTGAQSAGNFNTSAIGTLTVTNILIPTNSQPTLAFSTLSGSGLGQSGTAFILTNSGHYSDSIFTVETIAGTSGSTANTNIFTVTFGTPVNPNWQVYELFSLSSQTNAGGFAQIGEVKIPFSTVNTNGFQFFSGATALTINSTNIWTFYRILSQ
jgi:hypothetical protein